MLSGRPRAAVRVSNSSVALVCAMHPAVLSVTRWLDRCIAPEPYRTAWEAQRASIFQSVREGAWWGTIVSEAGTGGDVRKTRAIARRSSNIDNQYRISGEKQFGSGSGVVSYMITMAVPENETEPDIFSWTCVDSHWMGQLECG